MLLDFLLMLAAMALAAPAVDDGPSATGELDQIVRESNDCLLREVRQRLGGKVVITSEERSAIRMAAANVCYEYNEKLARFSKPYRDGSKTLKEVSEGMLVDSIQIADAFITTQLNAGAK